MNRIPCTPLFNPRKLKILADDPGAIRFYKCSRDGELEYRFNLGLVLFFIKKILVYSKDV